jgi:arsenate reductase-like glutaredoxin family protein
MLNADTSVDLSIKQIIANDIKTYSEELGIPVRQLIKDFSKNTNIVLRTLERFFEENRSFTPHVRTVVDIYSQIYSSNSLAEIISKTPPTISEFIKKNHAQCITNNLKVSNTSQDPLLQASLTTSSIFNQIYLMTSGDYGTDLAKVRESFGANGLKQLDEMIRLGFVEIDENDQVKRKAGLTWDRTVRKNFVKTLISDIYNEENTDFENPNHLSVAMGDVSPKDYNLILEKIKRNYQDILDIVLNSKPSYDESIRLSMAQILERVEFKVEGDKLC